MGALRRAYVTEDKTHSLFPSKLWGQPSSHHSFLIPPFIQAFVPQAKLRASPAAMDRSAVGRPHNKVVRTHQGELEAQGARGGARELPGKLPEGEVLQLCLTKREGAGHPELGGNLIRDTERIPAGVSVGWGEIVSLSLLGFTGGISSLPLLLQLPP